MHACAKYDTAYMSVFLVWINTMVFTMVSLNHTFSVCNCHARQSVRFINVFVYVCTIYHMPISACSCDGTYIYIYIYICIYVKCTDACKCKYICECECVFVCSLKTHPHCSVDVISTFWHLHIRRSKYCVVYDFDRVLVGVTMHCQLVRCIIICWLDILRHSSPSQPSDLH